MTADDAPTGIAWGSAAARWLLTATVLGSTMAFLDSTVVNVALPVLGRDLGADITGLQWIINGYLLTLASLILSGGALGDRFGRRRIYVIGTVWFAAASLLCAVAPDVPLLVAARILQGAGAALLTPGSLAILQSTFVPGDRARAIGAWAGLSGIATAVGPLLGGWLIDAVSWRAIFLLNLPVALAVVVMTMRHVPETRDPTAGGRLDVSGALLGVAGLAGTTYALIEAPARGWSPPVMAATVGGAAALVAFAVLESRRRDPMLPPSIFASRQFTGANLVTFAVYGALGAMFFLLVVQLQTVLGYSALEAGAAMLPITVLLFLLSPRGGALAQRIGPRRPLTYGPLVTAVGLALLLRVDAGAAYVTAVLPALVVFGLGLVLIVAPVTATVLAAAEDRHAGIASGVNNAVARVAGLLAVAALPAAAGLAGDDYADPVAFAAGFDTAIAVAAVLAAVGGVIAWLTIRDDVLAAAPDTTAPDPHRAAAVPGRHCAIDGPPLRDRLDAGEPAR